MISNNRKNNSNLILLTESNHKLNDESYMIMLFKLKSLQT